MRFDRLEKLITVLQEADPKGFSMERFGNACGTPACVLGHYAARRDIQRSFRFLPSDNPHPEFENNITTNKWESVWHDGEEVCSHFGIDSYQAEELFGGDGCNEATTPTQAIRFITKFIKTHKERQAREKARAKRS